MLLSLMLTIKIISVASQVYKKHVPNVVIPQEVEEAYNIEGWVNQLHLQQCVFVATGENNFAVFLETIPRPFEEDQYIRDYFLGICDAETLKSWKLCSAPLQQKRFLDCIFAENGQSSPRVHRRLCELSDLAIYGNKCNCNASMIGHQLFRVVGFPTLYRSPLPESLCGQNNVCGINSCMPQLVANRIYAISCDDDCYGRQPFCEMPEWESAKPREIKSFWTDWSEPICVNYDCQSQIMEATCINRDTGDGDIDCLGPGTSCCPNEMENCQCHVFAEDGALKVVRIFVKPEEPDNEEMSIEDVINNLPFKNIHRQIKNKHKSIQKTNRASASKTRLKLKDKRYWEYVSRTKREQSLDDIGVEQERNVGEDYVNENFVDYAKLKFRRANKDKKQEKNRNEDDDDDDDDDNDMEEDDGEEDIMIEEETEEPAKTTSEDFEPGEFNAIGHKHHKNETIVDISITNKSGEDSGVSTTKISIGLICYSLFRCLLNVRP